MPIDIARRLDTLRRATGTQATSPLEQTADDEPGASSGTALSGLSERLARISRTRAGALSNSKLASPSPRSGSGDDVLDAWLSENAGTWLAPGLAHIRWRYRYGGRHGNRTIAPPVPAAVAHFHPSGARSSDLRAIDTETTGLAGGTGTLAFLIGVTSFDHEALRIDQYLITRFAAEGSMLRRINDHIDDDALLLSYNGKAYDIPLLSTRLRLGRIDVRLDKLAHLDLVHAVRRTFKHRWASCRLVTVERELFALARRGDIPGHAIPQVWADWLVHREVHGLLRVVEHNRLDLLTLALLPQALYDAQGAPRHSGAAPSALAKEHLLAGRVSAALATLNERRCELDPPALHLLARLSRRHGDPGTAVAIWEGLAHDDDWEAVEQLAKHHEHRTRDYQRAYELSRRLEALRPGPASAHRQARVAKKRNRLRRT